MIGLKENRVLAGELCIKYEGYWRTWNRMLHMDLQGSRMVEVSLTPINPTKKDSWMEQIVPICIRSHTTHHGGTDRIFRHVVRNNKSIVFQEVRKTMLKQLPMELVHRLLNEDFMGQIDWDKYLAYRSDHVGSGGVPFAVCKKGN